MLHKTKIRKVAICKYGLSVPLLTFMLVYSLNISVFAQTVKKAEQKLSFVTPDNLMQYVGLSAGNSVRTVGKEGNIYVKFIVDKHKKAQNFKVMKSIGSAWEANFMEKLNLFADTVNLPAGNYYFIQGFAYTGNEDLLKVEPSEKPVFTRYIVSGPAYGIAREVEGLDTVPNFYLSHLSAADPIILVDGTPISYTHDTKGLKLHASILTKTIDKITVLKGDKAVEVYGEEARKGIVIISTKEQ